MRDKRDAGPRSVRLISRACDAAGGADDDLAPGTGAHLHPQSFYDAPVLQVLLDDLVDIGLIHVCVPDAIGINHDARPVFTAVEATGLVDADLPFAREAERLDARLRVIARLRGALRVARGTIAAVALVAAEEHVLCVVRHALF